MASQHGILGSDPMSGASQTVPQAGENDEQLAELKKIVSFSKSEEFERIKEYINGRVEFYKTYLPDGENPVKTTRSAEDIAMHWRAANIVIGELLQLIAYYEGAEQVLKDDITNRTGA